MHSPAIHFIAPFMRRRLTLLVGVFYCAIARASAAENALRFNSASSLDQRVTVSSATSYSANGTFTIEFWMRRLTAGVPATTEHLIGRENNSKSSGWAVELQANSALVRFERFGFGIGPVSSAAILDTNWHHIAFTRNSSGFMSLFVDGVLDTFANLSSGTVASVPMKFGNAESGTNGFIGDLDEIRFWGIDRNSNEILTQRRLPLSGSEGNLLGYWNFNEGANQVAADKSPLASGGVLGFSNSTETKDPTWIGANIPFYGTGYDSVAPTGKIVFPANGSTPTAPSLATLAGTAADNVAVKRATLSIQRSSDSKYWSRTSQIWTASYTKNLVDGTTTWTFPGDTMGWAPGMYTLTLWVEDLDANQVSDASFITIPSGGDTTPPVVTITSPTANGSYVDSQLLTVSGNATDNVFVSSVAVRITRLSDNLDWNGNTVAWVPGPVYNNTIGYTPWTYTLPISAWSQGGNYGITVTASDSSNNVASTSCTFTIQGAVENALQFNASSPTMQVASIPTNVYYDATSNITVEFWFRRQSSGTPTTDEYLIAKDNSGKTTGWAVFLQSGTGLLRFDPLGQSGGLSSTFPILDLTWHHFALTRTTGGYTQIVIDGNFDTSANTNTPSPSSSPIKIGNSDAGNNGFKGSMDEVRIWSIDRALGDIRCSRRLVSSGYEANLIGYWNMNESTGQYIFDKSTNHNDGVLGKTSATETEDAIRTASNIPNFGAACDTTPPTVKIINPTQNASLPLSSISTIAGTGDDAQSGLADIKFTLMRSSDGYFWNRTGQYWSPTYTSNNVDGLANWTFPGNAVTWSIGAYNINVQARDMDGNYASDYISFNVIADTETVAPTVSISYPVHGSTYADTQLTLSSGTASDNLSLAEVKVRITRYDGLDWDGNTLAWAAGPLYMSASGRHSWQYTMPISAWSQNGAYSLTAIAFDSAGNSAFTVSSFTVSNNGNDTIAPTLAITHPISGTTHASTALASISGTSADNSGFVEMRVSVQDRTSSFYWTGSSFTSASEVEFQLTTPTNWSFSIPVGSWISSHAYRVNAKARDGNNNFASTYSDFIVDDSINGDTIPPFVNIWSPTDGAISSPTALTINGNAGDNVNLTNLDVSIKQINSSLYYDGIGFVSGAQTFLAASGLATWSYSLPAPALANGSYQLTVRAKDASGNTQSRTVSFTITGASSSGDATAPVGSILMPAANTTYTGAGSLGTISGTALDETLLTENLIWIRDDQNKYFDGNTWSANTPVTFNVGTAQNWNTSVPIAIWKNGVFTIYSQLRDGANNITTVSNQFTINGITGGGNGDTTAPLNFVYNPTANANMQPPSFTQLTGRAEDPSEISNVVVYLKNTATNMYFNGTNFASSVKTALFPSVTSVGSGVDWSLTVPVAAYTNNTFSLEVEATDRANNVANKTVSFSVYGASAGAGDTTPPTIVIQSFQNNDTKTANDMTTIFGTGNDNNALDKVELEITNGSAQWWNGSSWQTTIAKQTAAGTTNWTQTFPLNMWTDGAYTVKAYVKDVAGNITQVTQNITISGTGTSSIPPTITITNVTGGQTYTPANLAAFSGATNGTTVRTRIVDMNLNLNWDATRALWVSETIWKSASVNSGSWSTALTPSYWPNGQFKIAAEATGSTGLISLTETSFYVSATGGSDFTAPAGVSLSAQSGTAVGSVKLSWTSPGDDGNTGTATSYTIKYSLSPITAEADWTSASDVVAAPVNQTPPVPLVAGTNQTMTVGNLSSGVAYFFALRTLDDSSNRSVLSNSPLAVAFSGCVAGAGDGEGAVTLSPSTLQTSVDTPLTLTFTIGTHGITDGGKIFIRVPDGFMLPQTTSVGTAGYFTATTSNGSVTLTKETDSQIMKLTVNGTLNASDTVTVNYIGRSYSCTLQSGLAFNVRSQASACGVPTAIASQPTVTLTAGPASWVGFDSYEKFATVDQATVVTLRGQNMCGETAAVTSDVSIQASVVTWNSTTYTYDPDTTATLSLASNMSGNFSNGTVTLANGQSTKTLYYKVSTLTGDHRVRIQYSSLTPPTYTLENSMNVIPAAAGAGITDVSIDKGQVGALKTLTFSAPAETVYVNYKTAANVSSQVKIKNGNGDVIQTLWGNGTPVRLAWNGDRLNPVGTAPSGVYTFTIEAAGQTNTELSATLQSVGVNGVIRNNSNSNPIANANIFLYGPVNRTTQSDNSGVFSIAGLTNGAYTVHVEKSGFAPKDVTFNFSGSDVNLGNVLLNAFSKIVANLTRTNTSSELWGSVRTIDPNTQAETWTSVRFQYGRTVADNGASTDKPEIFLKAGVSYQLRLDLPGYSATPLTKTLADGETYTWDAAMTSKKGVSGTISLSNDISNASGMWVYINAVKGTDTAPTKFAKAFIPAGESQAPYTLPDLDAGTYKLTFDTPGVSPQSVTITMASVDLVQNIQLIKGGDATFTFTFNGDTTGLDLADGVSDGKFPLTMRFTSDTANGSQTFSLNTHATQVTAIKTVSGVGNGTYRIYYDVLEGFALNTASPQTLTVAAGVGSLSSTFVENSGILRGTLTLPGGTTMGDMRYYLSRDNAVRTNATVSGNQFTFSKLGSGRYSLSLVDTVTGASKLMDVFVTNGQTTDVAIDMSAVQTFSYSGTVRTQAAPPNDSLQSIGTNSTPLTFYTSAGSVSVPALSVFAQLILADGTVQPLPTSASAILDPSKLKYAAVNTSNGTYQITGLEKGKTYRLVLNNDMNADGQADLIRNDMVISPIANQSGVDFTIRDGGKIQLTLTSPTSETGYALSVSLVDAIQNVTLQQQTISLVGTSASVEFSNLQVGRYLLTVADSNTTPKYAAAPQLVLLENVSVTKTVAMTLSESGRMQIILANRFGTLVTSANESQLLPQGFKIKVTSRSQSLYATLDASDGKYKASLLPGIDYTVVIEPPATISDSDADKSFLPVQLNARIDTGGAIIDYGVLVLKAGDEVSGTIKNESGTPLARVPVLAYQSLAKSVAPLRVFTNDSGVFKFTNLSSKVRFYDFVANVIGNTESLPGLAEARKNSIDISKSEQIANITMTLPTVRGLITGKAVASVALEAAYGDKAGQPGVSVLATSRVNRRVFEFISNPDGSFSLALPAGSYDLALLAKSCQPRHFTNLLVGETDIELGDITLNNTGITLSGKIRTGDGSMPAATQVSELVAVDTLKNRARALINKVSVNAVDSSESYVFYGLAANTVYDLISIDKAGRSKTLYKGLGTPSTDLTLDLTYNVTDPTLRASFLFKIPELNEIRVQISCDQAFRNKTTDADVNGVADDNELDNFLSVTSGNGTLVGNEFSSTRDSAYYTYTLGDETGVNALGVSASFRTEEINPKTGDNFAVTGDFTQPFGILSQQTNPINPSAGGELTLPNGAAVSIPADAFDSSAHDVVEVKLLQSEDVDIATNVDLGSQSTMKPRAAAMVARANKLGAKAYPVAMYKAIKALESTPDVNPFSSFYDVFLPAGVSHSFAYGFRPTITLKYDEGADPETLNIYYYNEAQNVYTLENGNRSIDPVNRTISVELSHFSIFTVLASSAPIIRSSGFTGELEVFNFPNPFDLTDKTVTLQNPGSASSSQRITGTMIKIAVPTGMEGNATIKIFNMAGELVRTLHADALTSGTHNYLEWDGTNESGADVASGVYLGRLEMGSQNKVFKMAVVK